MFENKTAVRHLRSGVKELVFIRYGWIGRRCERHHGKFIATQDAVAFDNETCSDCSYCWRAEARGTGHLHTLDEMRAAFHPSYYERFAKYNVLPVGLNEQEIRERIVYILHDYGQYDNGSGLARVHRLAGELYEHLKDWQEAITHYETALRYDPKVGVKRRLKELREDFDIEGKLKKLRTKKQGIYKSIKRIERKITVLRPKSENMYLYDEANRLQEQLLRIEEQEYELEHGGI